MFIFLSPICLNTLKFDLNAHLIVNILIWTSQKHKVLHVLNNSPPTESLSKFFCTHSRHSRCRFILIAKWVV